MASRAEAVGAVVLAGGRATRLAGVDKGLVELAGRPLVAHVLTRLEGRVAAIVLSANRNLDAYAAYGHGIARDASDDYPGPLAGLLAAAPRLDTPWLLCVPCDTPFLPIDLAPRLLAAARAAGTSLARAADARRAHFAVMLLRRELLADLDAWLAQGGRRVQDWQARHAPAEARFDSPEWAFLNINDAADLERAEAILQARPGA